MNVALITAGGVGSRMHREIPKQFLSVYEKPIIIYTLEAFQNHPNIDSIVVACLEGWEEILEAHCRKYGITKLESIVRGGKNGQDSIRNGLTDIAQRHGADTMVVIHDGNRPLVSAELISDCLCVAYKYGNAISSLPCVEALFKPVDGGLSSIEQIPRDEIVRTNTPHAARLGELVAIHKEALEKGITASVATCTLFVELGKEIYFSLGSEKNVKITTQDDLDIFKALLTMREG